MKSIQSIIICGVMMLSTVSFAQTPPLLTIREIQEPADLGDSDVSPYLGQTVQVWGIAATGPREIWIGTRWSFFLVDTVGGPWSGIQIVQHDSFASATDVGLIVPGDSVLVTGVVAEFDNGTQLEIITNPLTPVEFGLPVTFPRVFPQNPADVTVEDLQDTTNGEQWEETLVRLTNVKMLNNDLPGGDNQALIASPDGAFTLVVEDWNNEISSCLLDDSCSWPPNGTPMHIVGYVRDRQPDDTELPRYLIAPWSLDLPYIDILAAPPVITDVIRDPAAPSSTDAVTVTSFITRKTDGATASLHYSNSTDMGISWGAWQDVAMTENPINVFTGSITSQLENSIVKYYISAEDDSGFVSIEPGDTARAPKFYIVRDGNLLIQDIQFDPFGPGTSGFIDTEVTTTGIVTSDSTQFGNYWIQNGNGPWSGILINDLNNNPVPGDEVEVTGTIREIFGFTRMDDIVGFNPLGSGNSQPEPRVFNVGDINTGADSSETYEGVLVIIYDVTVTDPNPDHPRNFGEFSVGDASGDIRVENIATSFDGNDDSVYVEGGSLEFVRGYLYYANGDFKVA
ncbi:MAG: hypothetical protein IH825_08205, partial [Candidatus Marinimicrobia bacterium]|nr:hypothetical protein [Candidatus Neomarinimicrobiota bacterium]